VDYPGHAALQSQLSSVVKDCQRIVLVLDSTKSVAEAATVLYQILTDASCGEQRKNNTTVVPILLACHKSQLPGAKNWRRLKIQLRTELERLRKVKSAVTISYHGQTMEDNDTPLQENGISLSSSPVELLGIQRKSLDLDQLGPDSCATLHCLSVHSSNIRTTQVGLEELNDFVLHGTIPSNSKKQ
jgi:hypothetical protein